MKKHFFFLLLIVLFAGCASNQSASIEPEDWLIPADEVFDGGPGKDGIPSVDNPSFSAIIDIDFLADEELVVAIKLGNIIRVYPHPILDWHEIVNDEIDGTPFALTYCPLTGTGMAWNNKHNNDNTTFGVSGLLYNTNLIPYDRKTNSNWSQILLKSVSGERAGEKIETFTVIETSWASVQNRWPEAEVMNTETGFSRTYGDYPYGDYRTNDDNIIFPIDKDDDRRPAKERGLGLIVDGAAKYYGFDLFSDADGQVFTDVFADLELVLFGSETANYIVAYESQLTNGTAVTFNASTFEQYPSDTNGNKYNLFGEVIEGPQQGQQLQAVDNFIGYFFAWGTFYPDLPIAE